MSGSTVLHVVPIDERRLHSEEIQWGAEGDPDSTWADSLCRCNPRREYNSDTDTWIFIHNSFDGREGVEWAKSILNNQNNQND